MKSSVEPIFQEMKSVQFLRFGFFLAHFRRRWNTFWLAWQLKKQKKDFEKGKGVLLKSLRDLM